MLMLMLMLMQCLARKVLETGIHSVRSEWRRIRRVHPDLAPRQSPLCNEYDVHVNASMDRHVPVSE
jgi:hypothetical protein